MLARNSYPREYIDSCRRRVDEQVAAWRRVADATDTTEALYTLESDYFTNMLIALDAAFVHRTRAVEGKDGNPLNEVRVLVASIVENSGVMRPDPTIALDPKTSVLGYRRDDEITLVMDDFVRLAAAFFDEIDKKFAEPAK